MVVFDKFDFSHHQSNNLSTVLSGYGVEFLTGLDVPVLSVGIFNRETFVTESFDLPQIDRIQKPILKTSLIANMESKN